MLLTNHALTGILLSTVVKNDYLLAPTAFSSHFLMDGLPHFGHPKMKEGKRSPMFLAIGSIDFLGACTVTALACWAWPDRAVHTLIGVLSAAFPDLLFIPEILFGKRFFKRLFWVHSHIQWYERPPGFLTEAIWASLVLYLLRQKT